MTPIPLPAFIRIVRASAWYDIVLTALFATPWTFALAHEAMSATNQMLGGAALPPFGIFQTLIACLMGSVVLVWSVLRLVEPSVRLGRFDGTGRFLFSTWMAWALANTGAPFLWLLLVPEFAWGVVQWWPVARRVGS
ncbi:hypothetical protein NX774_22570 [Massilia agilis]|uniref:DUF4328 domain-containing protein n=1 Tax=Massilia agilis TaxID=1811226 RepID=A0ABT2DHC8_9BURK|nr:hypothetical protein [Massilia agilis]MCS0810717.1 hypothetical protein [Massilia agilis]